MASTKAVDPVFDAASIYLAVEVLKEELKAADCFGQVHYLEVQDNFTVKKLVLQPESLSKSNWFKALRSGEVIMTLLGRSEKLKAVLDKYNWPLGPVTHGDERYSWQMLSTMFTCNWQSLYATIDYLHQYLPVTVNGLDSSGRIIVDCVDLETARTIVIGGLMQCFVLLGKPSPDRSIQEQSCAREHQHQHQLQQHHHQQPPLVEPVDSNNNAGNLAKSTALQPKVNRLSNKKRVICIYDTTTSEESEDRASIDATPIDNRNSTDVKQQQQEQQRPTQQHEAKKQREQLEHQHDTQPQKKTPQQFASHASSPADGCSLAEFASHLERLKSMLAAGGPACPSCGHRLLERGADAAAAAAASNASSNAAAGDDDDASDSSSSAASASSPPPPPRQGGNASSSAAAVAAAPALPPAAPADAPSAAKPSRKRIVRRQASKRSAVSAAKLAADKRFSAAAADGASVGLARSRTRDSAKSTDADTHGQTRGSKKLTRGKPTRTRRVRRAAKSKDQPPPPVSSPPAQPKMEPRPSQYLGDGSVEQKAAPQDAVRHRAGSGDNRRKAVPPPQPVLGANANNDVSIKPITKSTVQDLITKLQAIIKEDA